MGCKRQNIVDGIMTRNPCPLPFPEQHKEDVVQLDEPYDTGTDVGRG
jgi:hypothetical protein